MLQEKGSVLYSVDYSTVLCYVFNFDYLDKKMFAMSSTMVLYERVWYVGICIVTVCFIFFMKNNVQWYDHIDDVQEQWSEAMVMHVWESWYISHQRNWLYRLPTERLSPSDEVFEEIVYDSFEHESSYHTEMLLDPEVVRSAAYEEWKNITMCSKTARLNLHIFTWLPVVPGMHESDMLIAKGDAIDLVEIGIEEGLIRPVMKDEHRIREMFLDVHNIHGWSLLDMYIDRPDQEWYFAAHRAVMFLGSDMELYVLDPYLTSTEPLPIWVYIDLLEPTDDLYVRYPSYHVDAWREERFEAYLATVKDIKQADTVDTSSISPVGVPWLFQEKIHQEGIPWWTALSPVGAYIHSKEKKSSLSPVEQHILKKTYVSQEQEVEENVVLSTIDGTFTVR